MNIINTILNKFSLILSKCFTRSLTQGSDTQALTIGRSVTMVNVEVKSQGH